MGRQSYEGTGCDVEETAKPTELTVEMNNLRSEAVRSQGSQPAGWLLRFPDPLLCTPAACCLSSLPGRSWEDAGTSGMKRKIRSPPVPLGWTRAWPEQSIHCLLFSGQLPSPTGLSAHKH